MLNGNVGEFLTADQEIRFACLELANTALGDLEDITNEEIVQRARRFYRFVKGWNVSAKVVGIKDAISK